MNKLAIFILLNILCCFSAVFPVIAADKDTVVAKGANFVMTRSFVKAIGDHYAKMGHYTKWEFLVDAALRIKLFAHEELSAISADDSFSGDDQIHEPESVSKIIELSEDYIFRLISRFPVDEKNILSYYRSYPEKFLKNGTSNPNPFQITRIDQPLDPEKIAPLDEQLSGLIRLRIAANNRQKIVSDELERLKEKYKVEMIR